MMIWLKVFFKIALNLAGMFLIFLLMRAYPTAAAITVLFLLWCTSAYFDNVKRLEKRLIEKDREIEHLNTRADKTREGLERQIERLSNR